MRKGANLFNNAAKVLLGFAFGTFVMATIYNLAIEDPTGFSLLLAVGIAAVVAALALTWSGVKDSAPRFSRVSSSGEPAPPPAVVPLDRSLQPKPSIWPLASAATMTTLAVGLAVGPRVVVPALIAGAFVALGALSQAWREDPSYTQREGSRVFERLIAPIGIPVLALTLIGVIVISISRVLLTVPKHASVVIAIVLAAVLLAAFFAMSFRPRIGRPTMIFLSGFAMVAVVTAGSISAGNGYRTFEHHESAGTSAEVEAKGTKYNTGTITVIQGQLAQITFSNQDAGVYHNIAVYTANPGGAPVWNGEPIEGRKKITYEHVFNLAPGTYAYRCDFHPTVMTGTFIVNGPGQ